MKDLTKVEYIRVSPKLTHEEMIELYNSGGEIHGFLGGIKCDPGLLICEVPENFPDNETNVMEFKDYEVPYIDDEGNEQIETKQKYVAKLDEEGNPVMRRKLWNEYTITNTINGAEAIMSLGVRDFNTMNRSTHVSNEEFRIWADFFGIENVVTKSEYNEIISNLQVYNTEI